MLIIDKGIFKFSRHYFCRDLEEKGRKYICLNFKKILKCSVEIKDLSIDELEAILRDDELNVRNEELVFEAIKIWVNVDVNERKILLPRLLNCVRFGLMNSKFFNNNILSWELIENDEVILINISHNNIKIKLLEK